MERTAFFLPHMFIALLLLGQNAEAAYVAPDYRGSANSTLSTWFDNGGNTWANGDGNLTSFIAPVTSYPLTTFDAGCGPGRPCLKVVGGDLEFSIPNFVDPLGAKLIRIQFKYDRSGAGSGAETQVIDILGSDPTGAVSALLLLHSTPVIDGDFAFGYEDWILHPNPDWEKITVSNTAAFRLAEVVIDTISIPEPATLLLIGAAILGLGFARRRA